LVHALLARGHDLSGHAGAYRPGIVHRLDKDTTGLLVVAKSDAIHAALSEQIKKREIERRYVAVVRNEPTLNRFIIDAPIGRDPRHPILRAVRADGKAAVTHVKVLRRVERGALLACKLETGRTHQIRVHLAHFGYEVWGDRLYAQTPYNKPPLQLHAAFLKFQHPASGAQIACFSSPPDDFIEHDLVESGEVTDWT
jgi:23S rRNA pseudouridine1911/1915/1917 synthase